MSLAATIDLRAAIEQLSPETVLRFALPLAPWNAATLAIEGHCLHRVTAACGRPIARTTAARLESACDLLSLFHYAAGATALSFLLRRRMGSSRVMSGWSEVSSGLSASRSRRSRSH